MPYNFKDGFSTVRLREILEPNYLDFALPIIKSSSYSDGILTLTTDKTTKAVLFSTPINSRLYEAEIAGRSNDMSAVHNFEVIDTNKDYYVGLITKEKQSILNGKIIH